MSRKDPSTRINSQVFSVALDDWAEKKYGPGFKKSAANIDLTKVLPEPVERETVRTWRYKRNPAVGRANLDAINEFLGVDCSLKITEEGMNLILGNKPLTLQGLLSIEIYRQLFCFLDSVTFDSTLDGIEGNYFVLQREIESRMVFLSPALKERVETALDEIVLPLVNEEIFSAEYASDIGHDTPEGFHVDNLPLLIKKHEEIMMPFREKLSIFAQELIALL